MSAGPRPAAITHGSTSRQPPHVRPVTARRGPAHQFAHRADEQLTRRHAAAAGRRLFAFGWDWGTIAGWFHLAGRTLRDLVLGRDTDRVHLPWVGRRTRRWELEPLRSIAVSAIYAAYGVADRLEASGSSDRTAWPAKVADVVAGR